jgi:hypothetical protein
VSFSCVPVLGVPCVLCINFFVCFGLTYIFSYVLLVLLAIVKFVQCLEYWVACISVCVCHSRVNCFCWFYRCNIFLGCSNVCLLSQLYDGTIADIMDIIRKGRKGRKGRHLNTLEKYYIYKIIRNNLHMNGIHTLGGRDCGFESRDGHGCLMCVRVFLCLCCPVLR